MGGTRVVAPARVQHSMRTLLVGTAGADLLVLQLAIVLGWKLRIVLDFRFDDFLVRDVIVLSAGPWVTGVWMLLLAAQGAYAVRNQGAGPEEFRAVAMASVLAAGFVGLACYLANVPLSRGFLVLTFAIGTPLLLAERFAVRKVLHRQRASGRLQHRVVAVGDAGGVSEVVKVLQREPHLGYEVVGACLPPGVYESGSLTVPVLGSGCDVVTVCAAQDADTVIVARGGYNSANELRRIGWQLEGSDVDLIVVPSLTDIAGPRISMRPVAGLPLLHLERPQAGEAGGLFKRLFDVTASFLGLLVLSPVLLVVAVAIKLQDGGPVLFRQRRVGRAGEPFDMLKFRTMVPDAETYLSDLTDLNEANGVLFKLRTDPRVTGLGRFLRRHSIDELPQLINVLRGEMSLVGPRPPLQTEVDLYHDDVHRRLLVRPGITGLWQVSGRSELSWDETVRLDLYYVDNWSMMSDMLILAKTARAVVGSSGAY